MFFQSEFSPSNVIQNSRYLVYTNQGKFDRVKDMNREIVSNTLKVKDYESMFKIFEGSKNIGIITGSFKFLDFYKPKQIKSLCQEYQTDIFSALHNKSSEKIYLLKSSVDIEKIMTFCIKQMNDLIFIDLDKSKTFISHHSYYITNTVTELESDNFPITKISDEEILRDIAYNFKNSVEDQISFGLE